jgi:hypothetical protein
MNAIFNSSFLLELNFCYILIPLQFSSRDNSIIQRIPTSWAKLTYVQKYCLGKIFNWKQEIYTTPLQIFSYSKFLFQIPNCTLSLILQLIYCYKCKVYRILQCNISSLIIPFVLIHISCTFYTSYYQKYCTCIYLYLYPWDRPEKDCWLGRYI